MENKIQWTNDDFIIFKSKQRSFEKYANIMKTFPLVNVAVNKDFQKLFNGFYRVRRGADWQRVYYALMQSKKNIKTSFEEILRILYEKTGRIEASFSSKLVHTLNPNMPIWDKFVLQKLGLKLPLCVGEEKIRACVQVYEKIIKWYQDVLPSPETQEFLKAFDESFPIYAWISQTKKLDFSLWLVRE